MKHKHAHENEKLPSVAPLVPTPETDVHFVPSPDEIARRAYFTYVNEGAPLGRHVQHWLDAEAQLIAERNRTRTHGYRN